MTSRFLILALCLTVGCSNQADVTINCRTPGACPDNGTYDVIVVGSGAGGGPLAARLARSGKRVLLLEAGDDVGGNLKYQVPAMHALATEQAGMAWWYFVQHHTDPQVDATDSKITPEGILYPRGSALGGSTAVNAMVTVLPSRSDWNAIAAQTGDPSWRATAMDPFYDRVREWLSVELADPKLALGDRKVTNFLVSAAATFDADATGKTPDLAQAASNLGNLLQHDVNEALRAGETTGLFRLPLATRAGRRQGTREWLLATAEQGYPLTIRTGAFVTRVLWDASAAEPTAVGVEFVAARNVYQANLQPSAAPPDRQQAYAREEVVLAAGTFNSPQLLLLSGVGERSRLERLGIAPVLSRPGVGQNLQDRYEAPVVSKFAGPLDVVSKCRLGVDDPNDPCLKEWSAGAGVYQTPGFLASVLMRSSPTEPLSDLQVFAVPTDARGYYPGYSKDSAAAKDRFTWLLLKAHTQNHDGSVELISASPFARPKIHFHSYDEHDPLADPDLKAMVEGVKFVRRVEKTMLDSPVEEVWPGPSKQTDAELAAWIRKESWGHHACCTDKLGATSDPAAVVDSRFRVIGAHGLRVVDASVFPQIPGTFIALPTLMVSEKAAAVLLEDHR